MAANPLLTKMPSTGPTTTDKLATLFNRWQGHVVDTLNQWKQTPAASLPSTGVTPGTYGDSTHVGQVTVNGLGQVTAAADVAISFPSGGVPQPSPSSYFFWDDFNGAGILPTWNVSAASSGTTTDPWGGFDLSTSSTSTAYVDWASRTCWKGNAAVLKWRVKADASGGTFTAYAGLATDHSMARFAGFKGDNSTFWVVTIDSGSGPVDYTPTVHVSANDGAPHEFAMDFSSPAAPVFKIDGVDLGPYTPALGALPTDALGPLVLHAGSATHTVMLDYFTFNGVRPT